MPKLSIVCPHYKDPKLIVDTINNVRSTCKDIDYELIIINDWMVDDSDKYIRKLLDKDIRYVPLKENVWVTKAWNMWVSLARWDYVCVINNDLITPKGFYEKLMAGFDPKDPELVMTMPRYSQNTETYVCYMYHHITGFCYMLSREGVRRLFPLDERMRIFGSDNWLWMNLKYGNMAAKVVKDAICHHLKSVTVKDIPNEDREIYLEIARQEWRHVKDVWDVTEEPEWDIIYSFNPKYNADQWLAQKTRR